MLSFFKHILATRHNVRAHFWQSLANYAQQGGSVVLGVFLARLLAPEDFGAIAYATALIGLICLPLDWTAAQVLVVDRGQTPELFSEVMSFGIIVMVAKTVVTAGVLIWQWTIGNELTAILAGMAGAGLVAGTAAGIYRAAAEGSGHFKANFHVQAITLVLCFIVGVGLAWAGAGVYALAFMGLVTIFPPLIVFPRYVRHQFHWRFNCQVIKSRGADNFWLWLKDISSNSLTSLDRLLLGRVVGDSDIGNYTRAYNYSSLSSFALSSLITNPTVVAFANANTARAIRKICLVNGALLALGATVSVFIFGVFATDVIPFLFGSQWTSAIPTFQAFSTINFFTAFAYLPLTLLLAKREYQVAGLVHLFAALILVCIAVSLGNTLSSVFMAYIFQGILFLAGIVFWLTVVRYLRA